METENNAWRMVDLVKAVSAYATEHYEEGWDTVVECYDDGQIAEAIGKARTVEGAISNVKSYLGLADCPSGKLVVLYHGVDGNDSRTFESLAEVQKYVRDHWQGTEYIDGENGFHTDYASYTLVGCALADVGQRNGAVGTDEWWDWTWKELGVPNEHRAD